jgi:hypothetical protein
MKAVKLSNLKVGDLFIHKGTVYEIIAKSKWTSCCRYLNDKYPRYSCSKYLWCDFSNYTKVEI